MNLFTAAFQVDILQAAKGSSPCIVMMLCIHTIILVQKVLTLIPLPSKKMPFDVDPCLSFSPSFLSPPILP